MKKYVLGDFLSADFWKNLKIKYNCCEKFLKNPLLRIDFKLQGPPFMYKINTHNISGVKKLGLNTDAREFVVGSLYSVLKSQIVFSYFYSTQYISMGIIWFCNYATKTAWLNLIKILLADSGRLGVGCI